MAENGANGNVPVLSIDLGKVTSALSQLNASFNSVKDSYKAVGSVLTELRDARQHFASDFKEMEGSLLSFGRTTGRLLKSMGRLTNPSSPLFKLNAISTMVRDIAGLGSELASDHFKDAAETINGLSMSFSKLVPSTNSISGNIQGITGSVEALGVAIKNANLSPKDIFGKDLGSNFVELTTKLSEEQTKLKKLQGDQNKELIETIAKSTGTPKKAENMLTNVSNLSTEFSNLLGAIESSGTSLTNFNTALGGIDPAKIDSIKGLRTAFTDVSGKKSKQGLSFDFSSFREVNEVLTKLQDFKGEQGDAKISVKLNKADVQKMQSIRSASGTLAKHLQTIDGLTNLEGVASSLSNIAKSFVSISKVSVSKQVSDLKKLLADIENIRETNNSALKKNKSTSVMGFLQDSFFDDGNNTKAMLGGFRDITAGRIGFVTDPTPNDKSTFPSSSKIGFGAIMDDWQDPAKKVEDTTEKLAEGSRKILDAMDMLKRALPPEFVDRIQIMNQHFVKISDTLFRLGSGFKNIAEYAEGASKVLKQLATPTHENSLDKNLTQLNTSLKETDVSYIYKVSSALRRLGEAVANISRHGPMGTQGIALMARGGSFTADGVTTQVSPIASYIDELMKSFDMKLTGRNKGTEGIFEAAFNDLAVDNAFEDSAFNQTTKMLSKLKNSLNFFRKDALAVMKTFKDPAFSKDFADGIRNFLKEIGGIFIKLPKATGQNEKNIAGISNMIHTLSSGLRGIMSLSSSASKLKGAGANLVEPITTMMEKLGALSKVPSFAGFERLADAMYKLSMGAKSVVTGVDKAERALRKYSETTSHAAKATNWFVGGWRAVVNAFTGGTVIYTIVRTIREAVDAFVEFDKKLRMINTLAGMSEKALSSLGSEIVATSGKFGLNLTQAADSMFAIQSATLRGADSLRVFNASAMLSVAGGADLRNSTELITRSIMAYGKHTTEAQHIADVLFKTQDRGITTIEELAHNLTKVIPSAVAARVSFEEINAAMATLTTKGLQTTVASTALNSMLLKLTSGSEKLDAVFQKLGYDSSATALKQRGLEFVMRQISAATGGAAYELQKLGFNYRDIKAAAILANDTSGFFAETLRYINDEAEEGGKALQAYKEVSKSLGQQIAQIVATLKGAIVGISEFVAKWSGLKVVLGLINSFVQVKSDFSTLMGAFKSSTGPIFKVVSGITIMVTSLTLAVGAVVRLKAAIASLSIVALTGNVAKLSKTSNIYAIGLAQLFSTVGAGSSTVTRYVGALLMLHKTKKAVRDATISQAVAEVRLAREMRRVQAALAALKASFMAFMKATAVLAIVAAAIYGISAAWDFFAKKRADKRVRAISSEFSKLTEEIDNLKTVTQVETRIESLSSKLEELASMSQTASVKALTKEYQKAIEKLNQKKMDLTSDGASGDAFNKLAEARKKLLMQDTNKFQQMSMLQNENRELVKQLALLPQASSAWAKMATKITDNTAKIKKMADELRDLYSFIPEHLSNKASKDFGDSIKGTKEQLSLKDQQLFMELRNAGLSTSDANSFLSQTSLRMSDYLRASGSMQGAQSVREKLLTRIHRAMGSGLVKNSAKSFTNQTITDMNKLGIAGVNGYDKAHLEKNLPEIMQTIAKLNKEIADASVSKMSGEDRVNETLALQQKRLFAIVQIQERLVTGNKNATVFQKKSLEEAKRQLAAYSKNLREFGEYRRMLDISSDSLSSTDWMSTLTVGVASGKNKMNRDAVEGLYRSVSSFRQILQEEAKKNNFDTIAVAKVMQSNKGVENYTKAFAKVVKTSLKKWYSTIKPSDILVGMSDNIPALRTTKDQADSIGKYRAAIPITDRIMKLLNEWHKKQFELNHKLAEAYRNTYGSTYQMQAAGQNIGIQHLVGNIDRDYYKDLAEALISPTGVIHDAVIDAGNVLKNAGVLSSKGIDFNASNFRDAATRALVQAEATGGEKGKQATQKLVNAFLAYQQIIDTWDKPSRMYTEALGTTADKLKLLQKDATLLEKAYKEAVKKNDTTKAMALSEAIMRNKISQQQLLQSMAPRKAVPVSEQVGWSSKDAYSLMYSQATGNENSRRFYQNVGDINGNVKQCQKLLERQTKEVAQRGQKLVLNVVNGN